MTGNDISTGNIPDNNINVSDIPRLDEPSTRTETFNNTNRDISVAWFFAMWWKFPIFIWS